MEGMIVFELPTMVKPEGGEPRPLVVAADPFTPSAVEGISPSVRAGFRRD